jgi:hypothetical protein
VLWPTEVLKNVVYLCGCMLGCVLQRQPADPALVASDVCIRYRYVVRPQEMASKRRRTGETQVTADIIKSPANNIHTPSKTAPTTPVRSPDKKPADIQASTSEPQAQSIQTQEFQLEHAHAVIASIREDLLQKDKQQPELEEKVKQLTESLAEQRRQQDLKLETTHNGSSNSHGDITFDQIAEFLQQHPGLQIQDTNGVVHSHPTSSDQTNNMWMICGSSLLSCLNCAICSKLMIDSAVLPCSHGFCRACLECLWRSGSREAASSSSSISSKAVISSASKAKLKSTPGYCPICNMVPSNSSEGIVGILCNFCSLIYLTLFIYSSVQYVRSEQLDNVIWLLLENGSEQKHKVSCNLKPHLLI